MEGFFESGKYMNTYKENQYRYIYFFILFFIDTFINAKISNILKGVL